MANSNTSRTLAESIAEKSISKLSEDTRASSDQTWLPFQRSLQGPSAVVRGRVLISAFKKLLLKGLTTALDPRRTRAAEMETPPIRSRPGRASFALIDHEEVLGRRDSREITTV